MKKIIQIFLLLFFPAFLFSQNYTILISFDGFRWDYSNLGITPTLDSIKANGVHAISLRSNFPTKTFPNHTSIITGMYCDNHGVISNNFSDTSGNWNTMGNISYNKDVSWFKGEAIWETLKKQGIKSASYFWPASDINDSIRRPDYYKKYDHEEPYSERIEGIINYLTLPNESRPKFLTLYFHETDHYGHLFGPNSKQNNKAIQLLDSLTNELFVGIRKIGLADSVNIIIVSDHGMTDIYPEKIINIEKILEDYDCLYQDNGPFMTIKPSEENIKNVYNILKAKENHYKVYTKDNIPEYFHYSKDKNIYPIILSAELGWSLVTNKSAAWFEESKGNHGYENNYIDMHGTFIACGPDFIKDYKTGTLWNIDIYPLLCKLYGVEPNANIDGKLERIEFILK